MINIVVALASEAKPLVSHFKLKRNHDCHEFPLHQNDKINLIVSGVGKLASAAATAFLGAGFKYQNQAWLNIGIAGHQSEEPGSSFLVNKIIDRASGQSFYPFIDKNIKMPSQALITVDQVENDYQDSYLYDMESSGFFVAANRISSLEFIQTYKVVSDNNTEQVKILRPDHVSDLIEGSLSDITVLLDSLQSRLDEFDEIYRFPDSVQALIENAKASETQKHQLRQLFYKLRSLDRQYCNDLEKEQNLDADALISRISSHLDSVAGRF